MLLLQEVRDMARNKNKRITSEKTVSRERLCIGNDRCRVALFSLRRCKNMKILEEFWYGNINPHEQTFDK